MSNVSRVLLLMWRCFLCTQFFFSVMSHPLRFKAGEVMDPGVMFEDTDFSLFPQTHLREAAGVVLWDCLRLSEVNGCFKTHTCAF